MDNFEEVATLICQLFDAFGRKRSASTIEVWARALEGLTADEVRIGIMRAIRECDQLPAPVVVRRFGQAASEQEAARAYEIAVKAVGVVGYVRGVAFEDLTINATIRAFGGWPAFCASFDKESEVWIRK